MSRLRFGLTLAALAAGLAVSPRPARADHVYLALGDSLAFGFQDNPTPSNGDRGYVGAFADELAGRRGGVRPRVLNFGAFTETSTTYFTGGNPTAALNTNYGGTAVAQRDLVLAAIANEMAAGNVIDEITLQIGANDLFAVATAPDFFTLTPIEQQTRVVQALGVYQANLGNIVGELRALLPDAELILLGYYDPYPAVPFHPFAPLAGPAIGGLNAIINGVAGFFGVPFVDLAPAFVGREAELTFIASSGTDFNVHPNAAGYEVIASRVRSVPEPASAALLAGGLMIGLIAVRRRRLSRTRCPVG